MTKKIMSLRSRPPPPLSTIERIPLHAPWNDERWWNDSICAPIIRAIRTSLADSAFVVASSPNNSVPLLLTMACGYAQQQEIQDDCHVYHTPIIVGKGSQTKNQRSSPRRSNKRSTAMQSALIARLEPSSGNLTMPPTLILQFIVKCAELRGLFQQALDRIQKKRGRTVLKKLPIMTRQGKEIDLAPMLLTISDDYEQALFCSDAIDVLKVLIALAGNKPEFELDGWKVKHDDDNESSHDVSTLTEDWNKANRESAENLVALLLRLREPETKSNDNLQETTEQELETPVKRTQGQETRSKRRRQEPNDSGTTTPAVTPL